MGKKIEVLWAQNTEFESWEERELKRRREKEREASRAALHRLERIIEFESCEEIELRRKRQKRDREASRIALDQLEKSVVFEDNLQAEMEITIMCRASPYYHILGRNPLNGLGLFLKRDDSDIDDNEEVILCGDYTTNKSKSSFKFHNGQINGSDQALSIQLSPKQAARVSMLKTRFVGVISKSQQQLGLFDQGIQDLKKQKPMINDGSFSNTRQYCKSKAATINAPMPKATLA